MDAEVDLCRLAEEQHGLVSRTVARGVLTRSMLDVRLRRGDWVAEGPRVLRRSGAPHTKGARLLRAVLDAGPGAVVSHDTAAAWWGLPGFDLLQIHVTRHRGISGIDVQFATHLHQVLDLSTNQVTVLDGVPIVRPERMAFELMATARPMRAERAIETAWAKGLLSGASLRLVFNELAGRGRAGTRRMRKFLKAHPDAWVPPASGLESRVKTILEEAGFGRWRRQVDLGDDRWIGRVDFRHERLPLVVEVQSERYHAALLDRAADAVRKAKLEAAGFTVVEVWDAEAWHDRNAVLAKVHEGVRRARTSNLQSIL